MNESCYIIVPTSSKYLDICRNFISVLSNSWTDCPYKIILSITGEEKKIDWAECLFNGPNASLVDCIVNASNRYISDYYMVFLGDAFMCGKVDTQRVKRLLAEIKRNKIDFCCLHPEKSRKSEKRVGSEMRYIHVKDRYCHCFGYSLYTKRYIDEMLVDSGISTDLEYELWYLNKTFNSESEFYYEHDAILLNNIFHIRCGIKKGKWDRLVYRWIERHYPEIDLAQRPKLNWMSQAVLILREKFLYLIPDGIRIRVKKAITAISGKEVFDTMN